MPHEPPRAVPETDLSHIWLRVLAAVWALTLLTAALTAAIAPLETGARELLRLRLAAATNPPPSLGRAAAIGAHNIQTVGWPLLLPLLNPRRRPARALAATAVAASTAANAILVGLALGAYGTRLLAFTPQLPLEWAGLALAPAAWIAARDHHDARLLIRGAAALSALLAVAALCETWLVPHR